MSRKKNEIKDYKNQHYVPQHYLKLFSIHGEEKQIYVFPKSSFEKRDHKRVFPNLIKHVACKPNFNQGTEDDNNSGKNEKETFQRMDGHFSHFLHKTVGLGNVDSRETLKNLILYLCYLSMNNPVIRDQLSDNFSHWEKSEKKCNNCGNQMVRHICVQPKHTTNVSLSFIFRLNKVLSEWRYVLIQSTDSCRFITSDNPVCFLGGDKSAKGLFEYSCVLKKNMDRNRIDLSELSFSFFPDMLYFPLNPNIGIIGFSNDTKFHQFLGNAFYIKSVIRDGLLFKCQVSSVGSAFFNFESMNLMYEKALSDNKGLLIKTSEFLSSVISDVS